MITNDKQFYQFCAYGFLKNLRFFDAFIILFLKDEGLTYTQIGWMYAGREIATNIMEIPSGIVSDTLGRKNSLLFSLSLYILSFLILYLGRSFPYFFIAFVLYGIANAFRSGTHKAMIMDYLKHTSQSALKVVYYGRTRSCSQMGSAISALFGAGMVIFKGEYRMIFLLSVFPYFLNFLNVAMYPSFLQISRREKAHSVKKAFRTTWREFFRLLKHFTVLRIIQSAAIYTAWIKTIKDYVQLVLIHLGVFLPVLFSRNLDTRNTWSVGVGYFILFIINAFASRKASFFEGSRTFRTASLLMLSGFVLGALAGGSYTAGFLGIAWLSFVGVYAIENIRKPLLTGVLSDAVPNDILGSLLSAQSLLQTFWSVVLALIMGGLADRFGVGMALLGLSAGMLLFTLLLRGTECLTSDNFTEDLN